jgi:hypothetical protein
MTTGAITQRVVDHAFVAAMNEPEAVETLLSGARAGHYTLPASVTLAADGAAALLNAYRVANLALANFQEGWVSEVTGKLAARLRDGTATTGSIPKGFDGAGELGKLRAEEAALRDAARLFGAASDGIQSYPATNARAEAETIAENLYTAMAELQAEAAPHAGRIAALRDGATNLDAHRADAGGFDALERLVPRLQAIEAAWTALAALGRLTAGIVASPADVPAVVWLAILSVGVD